MNRAEKTVYAYLKRTSSDIVYEPDGNIPPDFLVDRHLAVEVRTLNENYFGGNVSKGLERDQIRIVCAVSKALRQFDRPTAGRAYWVNLSFSRPLGDLKRIKGYVREKLQDFLVDPRETPCEIESAENVVITLLKAGKPHTQTFRIGMQSDGDSGGLVAGLYISNIRHCIEEKTEKISAHRARYPRWWLVLVDNLSGFSRDDPDDRTEIETVKDNLIKPSAWEKVMVISPRSEMELIHI